MAEPYNTVPPKPWQMVSSIPIGKAVLCANCDCITEAKNGHCPVCEGKMLLNLGNLLGVVAK